MYPNLRTFIRALAERNQIAVIDAEVDPHLEIAEIHRRVIAAGGPALLFNNVKGSKFPVVTNLFGAEDRVNLAFGPEPRAFIERVAAMPHEMMPPTLGKLWANRDLGFKAMKLGMKRRGKGPILDNRINPPRMTEVPLLTSWEMDGGPFVTLPLVYTEDPDTKAHNLGMYRIHRYDDAHTGLHWQIGKGGGFHHFKAELRGERLPVTLVVGGPPALILSAIAPLPENAPELILASLLMGRKLDVTSGGTNHPHIMPCEAEFCFQGYAEPGERRPEGPFGDHYGYYSLQHDYPVFHIETMYHRKDAVYPATVVGKPRQEDFYIGDYLQDLLSPLFPVVMPGVVDLWSYGETGYHSLSAAVLRERYGREALSSAFRILGEGQLSLTKFLIALDKPIDLKDFKSVLTYALERVRWETDLYIIGNTAMDTLDYTGPKVNKGSKGLMVAMGEAIRSLPGAFSGATPSGIDSVEVYCPGCLVVSGPDHDQEPEAAQRIAQWEGFADWPLIVLCDRASDAVRTTARFLWTLFTRFEPAGDVYARTQRIVRHHIVMEGPIVIDARMKKPYPDELFCDPATAKRVTDHWKTYFPKGGVEMGDGDTGHLDEHT